MANTTADVNTAIGTNCLLTNTTGTQNTAVGAYAADACTTGSNNTTLGYSAMGSNSTGGNNVVVGSFCMDIGSGMNYNVAMGHDTARHVTTGSNNIMLGHSAGHNNSPSGQITTGSNNICLGNNSTSNLYCADTSISSSDSRDKTDVTDFTKGLDWIKALRHVTYRWDRRTWYGTGVEGAADEVFGTPDGSKKRTRLHVGFLAQEALAVEQANGYGSSNDDSLVVNLNEDETSYGMKYERLVPILVNAIKELSTKNDTLTTEISDLKTLIKNSSSFAALKSSL